MAVLSKHSQAIFDALQEWYQPQRDMFLYDIGFQHEQYVESCVLDATYTRAEVHDKLHGLFLILQAACCQEHQRHIDGCKMYIESILREVDLLHISLPTYNIFSSLQETSSNTDMDCIAPAVSVCSIPALPMRIPSVHRLAPLASAAVLASNTESSSNASRHPGHDKTEDVLSRPWFERMQKTSDMYAIAQQDLCVARKEVQHLKEVIASMQCGGDPMYAHIQQLSMEISETKKEMSMRLSTAPQFVNMKRMMQDKNQIIRKLRDRLSKYEPLDADE